jgi:hypothetical protein
MKRTTIYLEPEIEVLLKAETLRQKRPMAELVREAVESYLGRDPRPSPPGAGAFASGNRDTASRTDEALKETGFGHTGSGVAPRKVRTAKRAKTTKGAKRVTPGR